MSNKHLKFNMPQTISESFQSALLPTFPILVVIVQAENWKIIHISSLLFLTFHIQYNSKSYSLTCMLNADYFTTSLQFSSLSPNKTPYSYYHPLLGLLWWFLNGIPASTCDLWSWFSSDQPRKSLKNISDHASPLFLTL